MSRVGAVILSIACLVFLPILGLMHFFQALFGSVDRAYNMAIGIDQTINSLFGGDPDETISARAHRKKWLKREQLINLIFFDQNHCKDAFESEKTRAHLPKEYKDD